VAVGAFDAVGGAFEAATSAGASASRIMQRE
jgi:hypothetical protein